MMKFPKKKKVIDVLVTDETMRRVDEEDDYFLMEKILAKWKDKKTGSVQYKVKWLGFPKSYDSWEPLSSFENCMEVIRAYEDKLRRNRDKREIRKIVSKYSTTRTRDPSSKIIPLKVEEGQGTSDEPRKFSFLHEGVKVIISAETLEKCNYSISM